MSNEKCCESVKVENCCNTPAPVNVYINSGSRCCGADGGRGDVGNYPDPILRTEFYVSQNGSDATGDGMQDNPWQTIQYAIDRISEIPKPSIIRSLYIGDGVYEEQVRVYELSLNICGNQVNPENVKIVTPVTGHGFYIARGSYISLSGIQFEHTCSPTATDTYLLSINCNSFGEVDNCIFNTNNMYITDIFLSQATCRFSNLTFTGSARHLTTFSNAGSSIFVLSGCNIRSSTSLGSALMFVTQNSNITIGAAITKSSGVTITGKQFLVTYGGMLGQTALLPACTVAGTISTGGTTF